jgi:hypothetical protein
MSYLIVLVTITFALWGLCPKNEHSHEHVETRHEEPFERVTISSVGGGSASTVSMPVQAPYGWEEAARSAVRAGYRRY